MIALVDCNNFYVECERLFQPHLKGSPIVVLSNNDGCVVSRSNEVKNLGIPMGIPVFQIRDDLTHNEIELFSSNYALYGDMSWRVLQTLKEFSTSVESYSIDESFLELPNQSNPEEFGQHIKKSVYQWTGIPVSIGIGSTKSLAKLANKTAKKHKQGVLSLADHPRQKQILDTIPISDVWGIGRRYTEKLNAYGIETAYQLSRAKDQWIQKHLTIVGLRIAWELRGISCLPLDLAPAPRKSIGRSRSFGRAVKCQKELREALAMHVTSATQTLRKQGSVAACMSITIETNPFVKPYYGKTITARFETPTASTPAMIKCAHEGLQRIYKKGESYSRAGIFLSELCSKKAIQTSLFWEPNTERNAVLMEVADNLMVRFGRRKIRWASEGFKQNWAMRQAYLSKRFTTNWQEIPIANA